PLPADGDSLVTAQATGTKTLPPAEAAPEAESAPKDTPASVGSEYSPGSLCVFALLAVLLFLLLFPRPRRRRGE
ncbi:MAG: hypothetical protein J5967_05260, partial [Oscillospiraceae bacterium]|nr:hypothetical protein [Oscillospiraceae bacterium]